MRPLILEQYIILLNPFFFPFNHGLKPSGVDVRVLGRPFWKLDISLSHSESTRMFNVMVLPKFPINLFPITGLFSCPNLPSFSYSSHAMTYMAFKSVHCGPQLDTPVTNNNAPPRWLLTRCSYMHHYIIQYWAATSLTTRRLWIYWAAPSKTSWIMRLYLGPSTLPGPCLPLTLVERHAWPW